MSERWRVPLSMIDDPDPRTIAALTFEQWARWRACRSVFFMREGYGEFDPRRLSSMTAAQAAVWRIRRREWLRSEVFRDDPRVDPGA